MLASLPLTSHSRGKPDSPSSMVRLFRRFVVPLINHNKLLSPIYAQLNMISSPLQSMASCGPEVIISANQGTYRHYKQI